MAVRINGASIGSLCVVIDEMSQEIEDLEGRLTASEKHAQAFRKAYEKLQAELDCERRKVELLGETIRRSSEYGIDIAIIATDKLNKALALKA